MVVRKNLTPSKWVSMILKKGWGLYLKWRWLQGRKQRQNFVNGGLMEETSWNKKLREVWLKG